MNQCWYATSSDSCICCVQNVQVSYIIILTFLLTNLSYRCIIRTNIRQTYVLVWGGESLYMKKESRERLLRYFQLWKKLPNITLRITDGEIQLYGRYKRFTGKRKIYLYLDNKQTYFLDTRNIVEVKFTKSFGLVYDVALKDCSGNTILIEHINQSF